MKQKMLTAFFNFLSNDLYAILELIHDSIDIAMIIVMLYQRLIYLLLSKYLLKPYLFKIIINIC